MQCFDAPYDWVVGTISIVLGVAFALIGGALLSSGDPIAYVVVFGFVALLLVTWGWAPNGYSVEPGRLTVHRPFRNRHVLLTNATTVAPFDRPRGMEFKGWRVGGLWGVYGEFRVNGQRIYLTGRRIKHAIAVSTGNEVTVVMPDRPDEFAAAIAQAALLAK